MAKWWLKAKCAGVETDVFYPSKGGEENYSTQVIRAKRQCLGYNKNNWCPVITECLLDALAEPERHGVWGGLSYRERRALYRKKELPAWITWEDIEPFGAYYDGRSTDEAVFGDEEEADVPSRGCGEVVDLAYYRFGSTHQHFASFRDHQIELVYTRELVSA